MEQFIEKRPQTIPCIVATIFLFLALLDLPYGYYQLLRLVVTGAAVWVAFIAYNSKKIPFMVPFVIIALLFNPLVPIRFDRELWKAIDLICAIGFVVTIIIFREEKSNKK